MALLLGQLGEAQPTSALLLDRDIETVIGALGAIGLLAVENSRAHQW